MKLVDITWPYFNNTWFLPRIRTTPVDGMPEDARYKTVRIIFNVLQRLGRTVSLT